ncbi:serine/arginine repetitive matrix protein 1-like [Bacillus rossius redtenbacheri]|uniref:serine/arginine repetitive matrix protein 1-like n=1 Tax=Bacillus rossius redtenbacheri TaxID=93214 RepID=UPI002FDEA229
MDATALSLPGAGSPTRGTDMRFCEAGHARLILRRDLPRGESFRMFLHSSAPFEDLFTGSRIRPRLGALQADTDTDTDADRSRAAPSRPVTDSRGPNGSRRYEATARSKPHPRPGPHMAAATAATVTGPVGLGCGPGRAEPSGAERGRPRPSGAERSRVEPSTVERGRAPPSAAESGRAACRRQSAPGRCRVARSAPQLVWKPRPAQPPPAAPSRPRPTPTRRLRLTLSPHSAGGPVPWRQRQHSSSSERLQKWPRGRLEGAGSTGDECGGSETVSCETITLKITIKKHPRTPCTAPPPPPKPQDLSSAGGRKVAGALTSPVTRRLSGQTTCFVNTLCVVIATY